MLLYYITDRKQFPGTERDQRCALLDRIAAAATAGVDYIQLREKDLSGRELEGLAKEALEQIRNSGPNTRLLINSRIDVALAVGADGVHLTSNDVSAADARSVWTSSLVQPRSTQTSSTSCLIGVSCHTVTEVRLAESHGADLAVLAPVFEKAGTKVRSLGLETLREASRQGVPPDRRVEAGDRRATMPVFPLGGVTLENAEGCLRAGAAGIAGIRIFQEGDLTSNVEALRKRN